MIRVGVSAHNWEGEKKRCLKDRWGVGPHGFQSLRSGCGEDPPFATEPSRTSVHQLAQQRQTEQPLCRFPATTGFQNGTAGRAFRNYRHLRLANNEAKNEGWTFRSMHRLKHLRAQILGLRGAYTSAAPSNDHHSLSPTGGGRGLGH